MGLATSEYARVYSTIKTMLGKLRHIEWWRSQHVSEHHIHRTIFIFGLIFVHGLARPNQSFRSTGCDSKVTVKRVASILGVMSVCCSSSAATNISSWLLSWQPADASPYNEDSVFHFLFQPFFINHVGVSVVVHADQVCLGSFQKDSCQYILVELGFP